jgi:hypothetical protein
MKHLFLLQLFPLITTLALGGCASAPPSWLAWQDSVSAQRLEFRVPRDSGEVAYRRAIEWLDEAGAERTTTNNWLVESAPTERTGRIGYSIHLSNSDSTTTIEVRYDAKPRELYEFPGIFTGETRARELARYIRTGERYDRFAQSYTPDSATMARAARKEEERPSRIWIGGGVSEEDPWLDVGLRHGWIGGSYTFVLASQGNRAEPSYIEGPVPADAGPVELFGGDIQGISAIGFLDLNDNVSVYGSIGGFVRSYRELRYSPSEGRYYLGEESPQWHDPMISVGAGTQVTFFRHLVMNAGYATATGFSGGIGIRF